LSAQPLQVDKGGHRQRVSQYRNAEASGPLCHIGLKRNDAPTLPRYGTD